MVPSKLSALALVLLAWVESSCEAFVSTLQWHRGRNTLRSWYPELEPVENAPNNACDIVLFGLGDLRVDDHIGLHRALSTHSAKNTKIVPLCILDDQSLASMPGAVAHTADTAQCIHHAVSDLKKELESRCSLQLQTVSGGTSLPGCLSDISSFLAEMLDTTPQIRVHVCDLGPADNQIGYGPYAQLASANLPKNIEIVPWTQDLRSEPWKETEKLPTSYPNYTKKFCSASGSSISRPVSIRPLPYNTRAQFDLPFMTADIPSSEQLMQHMRWILSEDCPLHQHPGRVAAEHSSGLYMTHWGGLPADSIGCRSASQILDAYVTKCDQNDGLWAKNHLYPGRRMRRNRRSLEHASMEWQLRGDRTKTCDIVEHWIEGEAMTRFLTAPLLLGTLSPRRIWSESQAGKGACLMKNKAPLLSFLASLGQPEVSPLKQMVESREWHRLLAAHNIASDPAYRSNKTSLKTQGTSYRYWRYMGFLCRYAVTPMARQSSSGKDGILMLHGFGANGAQFNKAAQEIGKKQRFMESGPMFHEGLAPDILGFGESEKPILSYTGYMWDSAISDFVKERAVAVHGWNSFVVAGNSVGGFIGMSAAACDTAKVRNGNKAEVTSTGAPGTGMCKGLVLMNPLADAKTHRETEELGKRFGHYSVAEVTSQDALPVFRPMIPRAVARAFGNTVLTNMRERIRSTCTSVYPTNPSAVTTEMCKTIKRDSLDPGAINIVMSCAKLPAPRPANELLNADFKICQSRESTIDESTFRGPVLMAQGVLDIAMGDPEEKMHRFGALREGITMHPLQCGHCPHDEQPEQVAESILSWMQANMAEEEKNAVGTKPKTVLSYQHFNKAIQAQQRRRRLRAIDEEDILSQQRVTAARSSSRTQQVGEYVVSQVVMDKLNEQFQQTLSRHGTTALDLASQLSDEKIRFLVGSQSLFRAQR